MKSTAIYTRQSEGHFEGIKSLAKTSPGNSSETRTDELSETSSFLNMNYEFSHSTHSHPHQHFLSPFLGAGDQSQTLQTLTRAPLLRLWFFFLNVQDIKVTKSGAFKKIGSDQCRCFSDSDKRLTLGYLPELPPVN